MLIVLLVILSSSSICYFQLSSLNCQPSVMIIKCPFSHTWHGSLTSMQQRKVLVWGLGTNGWCWILRRWFAGQLYQFEMVPWMVNQDLYLVVGNRVTHSMNVSLLTPFHAPGFYNWNVTWNWTIIVRSQSGGQPSMILVANMTLYLMFLFIIWITAPKLQIWIHQWMNPLGDLEVTWVRQEGIWWINHSPKMRHANS